MIIEYKLNINDKGTLVVPGWIQNGGFLQNSEDFTLIGFSPSVHEYYIPDTVVVYTIEELKTRSLNIHQATPYRNLDGSIMTETEVLEMVQAIVDANDIA